MQRLMDQFKIRLPHIPVSVIKTTYSNGANASRLNVHSKKDVISKLDKMKLKKEDVVVVDGFCNALLCTNTADPFSTTKALKPLARTDKKLGPAFHTCTENGNLLVPVEDKTVSDQCKLITTVAEAAGRSGAKVLVLGPLPRFPIRCCSLSAHGAFKHEFDFSNLARDINLYVTAANTLNTHRHGGNILAVPFDVIVRDKIECAWDGSFTVKYDNVHVHEWVLDEMVKTIITIAANKNIKDLGLPEQHPCCYGRSFQAWREDVWEKTSAENRLPPVHLTFPVGEPKRLAAKNPRLPGIETNDKEMEVD